MRGTDETSGSRFNDVDLEERVPARHPLRLIRRIVNDARASLVTEFGALFICFGRTSIVPERLMVQADLNHTEGHREKKAARDMINRHLPGSTRCLTLGVDKAYDSAAFV